MIKKYTDNKLKMLLLASLGIKHIVIARIYNVSRQLIHQLLNDYETITDTKKSLVCEYYGSECVICGKVIYLQVHHIDNNSNNNNLNNLVLLCRKCHAEVHKMARNRDNYLK